MLAAGLTGCQPREAPDAGAQTAEELTTTASTLPPVATTTQPATTTTVPVKVIEVIERAGWGAAAAGAGMEEHVIERLTIHHTGVALEDNREAPARLRAHQVFHQTDRGWPDLAYHFAIDRNANIYEGRSPEFRGDTATSYDPTGHFLVVLEGNFDVEPTAEAQLGSLTHLLAWAAVHYSVGVDSIKSHRDYAPGETSCPGDNVYALLESGELVREVEALVTKESIELIYLRGEEAVARVAEIETP
jgi:N-acetylmuramoyl-L-alanine amidase-like protein